MRRCDARRRCSILFLRGVSPGPSGAGSFMGEQAWRAVEPPWQVAAPRRIGGLSQAVEQAWECCSCRLGQRRPAPRLRLGPAVAEHPAARAGAPRCEHSRPARGGELPCDPTRRAAPRSGAARRWQQRPAPRLRLGPAVAEHPAARAGAPRFEHSRPVRGGELPCDPTRRAAPRSGAARRWHAARPALRLRLGPAVAEHPAARAGAPRFEHSRPARGGELPCDPTRRAAPRSGAARRQELR